MRDRQLAAERCARCRHPHGQHTEWWDANEDGGGDGFGCVACDCPDFIWDDTGEQEVPW